MLGFGWDSFYLLSPYPRKTRTRTHTGTHAHVVVHSQITEATYNLKWVTYIYLISNCIIVRDIYEKHFKVEHLEAIY